MTKISLTRKLAIVLVSLLPYGIAHADKIIIASDPWMPHTGHEEGDNGYILDLAIAILEEAGHDVEYVVRPWSRAISDTREGKLNAIAACFQEEAEDFIFPDNAIGLSRSVFYANTSLNWEYTGPDSLEPLVLGVIQDYSYGEELDEYLAANQGDKYRVHVFFGDDPQIRMIEMLNRGRIDTMIVDQLVIENLIIRLNLRSDHIEIVTDMGADDLWLGFSPAVEESAEYAQIISDGIERYRNNGKMAKILGKYGLSVF